MSFLLILGSKYCWAHSDTSHKRCNSISGFGLLKKNHPGSIHGGPQMFVILSVILINLKSAIVKKQTKQEPNAAFLPCNISFHDTQKRETWMGHLWIHFQSFFNYREAQICNMSSFVLHLILSSLTNHN